MKPYEIMFVKLSKTKTKTICYMNLKEHIKESILAQLNRICEKINSTIHNPNYGGCGIIAERIYTYLQSHNIPCKIVVFTDEENMVIAELKNGIPLTGNKVYSRAHVCVKLDENTYIDSYGIEAKKDKMCNMFPEIEIPFKYLVWWNLDFTIWNRTFDRFQIPLIDKIFFNEMQVVKEVTIENETFQLDFFNLA